MAQERVVEQVNEARNEQEQSGAGAPPIGNV